MTWERMEDSVLEAVHAPVGHASRSNRVLVQKICRRAIQDVCRKEAGALGTEPLNEMFACSAVS